MANVAIQTKPSAFGIVTYTNIVMCLLLGDRKVKAKVTLEQTTKSRRGE
jgi:hypothetical protein